MSSGQKMLYLEYSIRYNYFYGELEHVKFMRACTAAKTYIYIYLEGLTVRLIRSSLFTSPVGLPTKYSIILHCIKNSYQAVTTLTNVEVLRKEMKRLNPTGPTSV